MDEEIRKRLDAQDALLHKIFESVEKTRKYMLISVWATVLLFVLPLVGLVIIIPMFIGTYLGGFEGYL